MDYFEKKYLEQFGITSVITQYLCFILGVYAPCVLAKRLYKKAFQCKLDLRSPKNLNEKINWLEFNTDTLIWSLLTDKLLVRKYVMMQGLGIILTKLYGAWENINTIDFESLPKSFVLKCNHDSGSTRVVLSKTEININEIVVFLRKRMSRPYGIITAEPHYRQIKRFVLAEELIQGNNILFEGPINYKFWCFYGDVLYCHVQYRHKNGSKGAEMYRLPQWQYIPNALVSNNIDHLINAPTRLNEMMNIATKLSRIFPQCRVDLYESDERIYFGEITFTAGAGRINDYTSAFLKELGDKVVITNRLNYKETINGIKSPDTI